MDCYHSASTNLGGGWVVCGEKRYVTQMQILAQWNYTRHKYTSRIRPINRNTYLQKAYIPANSWYSITKLKKNRCRMSTMCRYRRLKEWIYTWVSNFLYLFVHSSHSSIGSQFHTYNIHFANVITPYYRYTGTDINISHNHIFIHYSQYSAECSVNTFIFNF